jgi:hypothetical protein
MFGWVNNLPFDKIQLPPFLLKVPYQVEDFSAILFKISTNLFCISLVSIRLYFYRCSLDVERL